MAPGTDEEVTADGIQENTKETNSSGPVGLSGLFAGVTLSYNKRKRIAQLKASPHTQSPLVMAGSKNSTM